MIFPSFGLLIAPREDLPVCDCPSRRGLENRPPTWPLGNRQMLQRDVLSGHPNWAVGSGTALDFLSAKQSISLLVYWNTNTGNRGKTKPTTKKRWKKSKLLQILVCWRPLLWRLLKKTVSLNILLRFLLLFLHIANFVAKKAARVRRAEMMYGNIISCCSNSHYSVGMSTQTLKLTSLLRKNSEKKYCDVVLRYQFQYILLCHLWKVQVMQQGQNSHPTFLAEVTNNDFAVCCLSIYHKCLH